MHVVKVELGERSYDIRIGVKLDSLGEEMGKD